jgi:phosphoglycerate dehydrogenase-like enzyme
VTIATFEEFDERDAASLGEAEREFGVAVARRSAPAGDEAVILVEHRTLALDDLARMRDLQTLLLFDYGRALLPANGLAAKGVSLRRVPNLAGLAVAEQTFALLLALKKRLLEGHRAVVENVWRADVAAPLYTDQRAHVFNWSGLDRLGWLYGETLGIVGFGRIGRAVAARAQAFGMEVLYHNRHRLAAAEEARLGVRYAPLADLLAAADAVTLHLPFSAESEHLLGPRELGLMKPTAFLINAARGRVVDEAALLAALERGAIAGAGLDVLTYEPPHPDNPLLRLGNVVFSPHVGGVHSPLARREQFRTALRWAAQAADQSDGARSG